jgi:photosystem II stability/assembly factor-like uncharacterized protein
MRLYSLLCLLILPLSAQGQWHVRMSGLPASSTFQEVALADSSTAWVNGGMKIWQSTNLGRTWALASNPTGFGYPTVLAACTHTTLIYGTDGGKIVQTKDGGAHWAVVFNDSSVTSFINDLVMFDSLQGFAMGDPPDSTKRPGLLKTSDGGASWRVVLNDLPAGDIQSRDRTSFVRPDLGWTKVWNDGIYKTTNGGLNWQRIYTPLAPKNIFFRDDSVGFYSTLGSPTGLFKTKDGGLTWSQRLFGPPLHWVRWATGGEILWAGADTLYMSTDAGESWQAVLSNRAQGGSGSFQDAAFFKDNRGLVAGMGLVLALEEGPNFMASRQGFDRPQISLHQNFPNPFNPTTTIRYVLSQSSHVVISIYNSLGELVATLVNQEQQAGSHQVELSGAGLATGMYFCRLQAGGFIETKKILLVK